VWNNIHARYTLLLLVLVLVFQLVCNFGSATLEFVMPSFRGLPIVQLPLHVVMVQMDVFTVWNTSSAGPEQ
jgi:hypothetical protein